MVTSIFANPGQKITLAVQVIDGYGGLHDGYQAPTVDFLMNPAGNMITGYPTIMSEIATGIWKHTITLPSGASAIGPYLASCSWPHPDTGIFQNEIFILNVALPFGNTSISPS